mgnify:CR=1 FL=1
MQDLYRYMSVARPVWIKELLIMSADIIGSEIKNRELVTDDQEISLFIAQKNKEFLEGQVRVEENFATTFLDK